MSHHILASVAGGIVGLQERGIQTIFCGIYAEYGDEQKNQQYSGLREKLEWRLWDIHKNYVGF